MRGLTERQALVDSAEPGEGDFQPPEVFPVFDALERRGCISFQAGSSDEDGDYTVARITPRGRLALQCDAAVRAVLA